jgi:hypothetical protein
MHLRRLLPAVVAVALAGPTAALATSSPAAAATTATHVVGADNGPWLAPPASQAQPGALVYGDRLSLAVNVVTDGGEQVFEGTLAVQRRLAGASAWTTVATTTTADLYSSVRAVGNATYRVLYSGTETYAASSVAATVKVQHKLALTGTSGRQAGIKGAVSPKYRGPVTVLKKTGKRWTKFKTVRTSPRSRFFVTLPAPRKGKYFWRLTIRSSRAFAVTQSPVYYTTRYRAARSVS